MGLGIPPLKIKMMFESNPLKSITLVRRLAVGEQRVLGGTTCLTLLVIDMLVTVMAVSGSIIKTGNPQTLNP